MNETLSFNYKLSLYYISTDGCDFCGRNPTELFAVETPLSDEDKAMLLVIFVVIERLLSLVYLFRQALLKDG